MSDFNPAEVFAPSDVTRRKWLYTPKQKKKIAGVTLHGIFSTHHYARCWQAVFAILIIEAVTLYLFYDSAGSDINIIYIVLAAAIVDFVLIFFSHKDQDDIIELSNEIAIQDKTEDIQRIERKLQPMKMIQNISYSIIFILAVLKCAAFKAYYVETDGIFFGVCAAYLLEAYLHVKFTGYIWYTEQFLRLFSKEHDDYIKDDKKKTNAFDNNTPKSIILNSSVPLKENTQGRQEIKKDKDGVFRLLSRGVLTDDEILRLASSQEDIDAQRVVIKAGIKHQLQIMQEKN